MTGYIARRNTDPKPFTWTASLKHILEKGAKAKKLGGPTLEAESHGRGLF